MKTSSFLLINIIFFIVSNLSPRIHVNSQAAATDSCASNVDLKRQLLFDTTSLICRSVWDAQGFILRYEETSPNLWSFILSAPNTNSYIGMGFSSNGKMVGSSAIVGWIGADGGSMIKRYHLTGQKPRQVVPDEGNLQVVGNSSSLISLSGRVYIAFQLNTSLPENRILYSVGPAGRLPVRPGFQLAEHDQKVSTILNYASGNNTGKKTHTAVGVAVSMLILFLLCFICYRAIKTRHNSSSYPKDVEVFIRKYGPSIPKRFRYSTLKKITNSFKEELGKGGYGNVYKGSLSDGCVVAVKVLKATKGNGEEFMNEVASIGRTSHVNVVSLLGFVYEDKKRALIYEFMPNGSLEKFIHGTTPSLKGQRLSWEKLYSIALGIARGLEYLHCGCTTQILHFDIKPHNILLDEDFCPKISDFGLAKLYTRKESVLSSIMQARGTIGYIAPEVISRNFGQVSHKSDVYSYGMMILEMVGGRKNVDTRVARTSEIYFPRWVYKHIHVNEETSSADNITEEENHIVRKMMIVGLWCIQTNPSQRPSISKVIEMFEGNLAALEIPPKPYMCSPPTSPPSTQQKTLSRSSSLNDSNSSPKLVPRSNE